MPEQADTGVPREAPGRLFQSYRGFRPVVEPASARDIRDLWQQRLARVPDGHPIWLHVHVPYCPQTCAYCHCGRVQMDDPRQLEDWLDRTCDAVEFFGPVMERARVRHLYVGGGTPNLLSPPQLDRLLTAVETRFHDHPDARKTLEVLPSAYRPGLLPTARRHGVRRMSCGVQSTSSDLLGRAGRHPDFVRLGPLVAEAVDSGLTDINFDLAWGLGDDSEEALFASLEDVLALDPTTVSIHLIMPTPTFQVFDSEAGHSEMFRRFLELPACAPAAALARRFPGYQWRRLPTVMVLVKTAYVEAGQYMTAQYSDTETVGMDSFGLGRFSESHLLGRAKYEDQTRIDAFDPDEAGFRLTRTDGTIDGAMDALALLLRDRCCPLDALESQYGVEATVPVRRTLDALAARGDLVREGRLYRYPAPQTIWFGAIDALYDQAEALVRQRYGGPAPQPLAPPEPAPEPAVEVAFRLGTDVVRVLLERRRPGATYFAGLGDIGIFYRTEGEVPPAVLSPLLGRLTQELRRMQAGDPRTPGQAGGELATRMGGQLQASPPGL